MGCLLRDAACRDGVFGAVDGGMFRDGMLGRIFEALKAQHEEGLAPDPVVAGEAAGPGAAARLAVCEAMGADPARAADYAEIVRENWRMARLREALGQAAERCGRDGAMVKDILPLLEGLVEHQRELEEGIRQGSARVLRECVAEWTARMQQPSPALKTGYPGLDFLTGGLQRKGLYVLAARPGKGKTDFALNLALRMCRRYRVNYNTMEMPREQCTQRLVSNLTGINDAYIRDRRLDADDWRNISRATEALCGAALVLDEKARLSAAEVKSCILRHRPDLIVLDSLQLMEKNGGAWQRDYEAVARTTHMLKELAIRHDVVILLLVQENREADRGGAPVMAGLYGGAAVEQDADGVMFIRREEPGIGAGVVTGDGGLDAKIHLVKNRHGGTGVCRFQYQPQYHRFLEIVRQMG